MNFGDTEHIGYRQISCYFDNMNNTFLILYGKLARLMDRFIENG